ncbi:unnamed protein product [Calypogeia fissa]
MRPHPHHEIPTTPAAKKTMKSGMDGNDVNELHDALTELGFIRERRI